MNTTNVIRCNRKNTEGAARCETHSFKLKDSKGRELGARVYFFEVDYVEWTPEQYAELAAKRYGSSGHTTKTPGSHFFGMRGQATRAGKDFGSGGRTEEFATEAERAQAVAKYLKGVKARAPKLAA